MTIRPLGPQQVEQIHRQYMPADFPPDELRPASQMLALMAQGRYVCWGLFAQDQLLAYAFYYRAGARLLLLDYLAVLPQYRGQGLGSRLLHTLDGALQGACVLSEVEAPTSLNPEENALRRRRIAFYQRAGFVPTPVEATLFGVRYVIIGKNLPAGITPSSLRALLRRVYRQLIPVPLRFFVLRFH